LGATWLLLSILILALLWREHRSGERSAWWALWLPLLWLSHFVFHPETVHNLVIAVITAMGPLLSYAGFSSDSAERPGRVS
jgi:hypothetical protein